MVDKAKKKPVKKLQVTKKTVKDLDTSGGKVKGGGRDDRTRNPTPYCSYQTG